MKNIDYSFITHFERQNLEKERHYIHHDKLFVIIDGVGRDYLDSKATNLAYTAILEIFFRVLGENNSPADAILSCLKQANRAILEERIKIKEKMAASVCILFIDDRIMYFSHLGDARIYSFQDNELNQLTRDHTLREEDPFAEKRYNDPRALQALIKGLGIHEEPDIYIKKYPLEKKGFIILTTERLTERITNRDIYWLFKKIDNPKKLVKSIVELFNRKGGDERFSLGIIRYGVLPKWLKKILSIYLVFFLFIIAVVGVYFMKYNDHNIPDETTSMTQPIIVEDITINQPELGLQKISSQSEERAVVRQPIIVNKENDSSNEKPALPGKESIGDISDEIHLFLNEWKIAWEMSAGEKGNITEYISFYSNDFRSGRLNKSEWSLDKSRKNSRKKWIRVELFDINISNPDKNNQIRVKFSQDYRSSNFSVVSEKVLQLEKVKDKWVILSEKSK